MLTSILHWVERNPQWIGMFLYSILECYLGKTKKVSSNSVIALIWNVLFRRKP